MGINQMTGQPWHKERIHRAEGDERRYKGRCKYFDYDGEYCDKKLHKCYGSAHCEYYFSLTEEEFNKKRNAYQRNKVKQKSKTSVINRKSNGFSNIETHLQTKKEKRKKKLERKKKKKEAQLIQEESLSKNNPVVEQKTIKPKPVIANKQDVSNRIHISDSIIQQYLIDAPLTNERIKGVIAVVFINENELYKHIRKIIKNGKTRFEINTSLNGTYKMKPFPINKIDHIVFSINRCLFLCDTGRRIGTTMIKNQVRYAATITGLNRIDYTFSGNYYGCHDFWNGHIKIYSLSAG